MTDHLYASIEGILSQHKNFTSFQKITISMTLLIVSSFIFGKFLFVTYLLSLCFSIFITTVIAKRTVIYDSTILLKAINLISRFKIICSSVVNEISSTVQNTDTKRTSDEDLSPHGKISEFSNDEKEINDSQKTEKCDDNGSTNTINDEIECFINLIMKDFVQSWYKGVSADPNVLEEINDIFYQMAVNLSTKLEAVNHFQLYTRILNTYRQHLTSFHVAHSIYKSQPPISRKHRISQASLKRINSVEEGFESKFKYHPALVTPSAEIQYLRSITKIIFLNILPENIHDCRVGNEIINEILVQNMMQHISDMFSEPEFLHWVIVKVFSDEDFRTVDEQTLETSNLENCELSNSGSADQVDILPPKVDILPSQEMEIGCDKENRKWNFQSHVDDALSHDDLVFTNCQLLPSESEFAKNRYPNNDKCSLSLDDDEHSVKSLDRSPSGSSLGHNNATPPNSIPIPSMMMLKPSLPVNDSTPPQTNESLKVSVVNKSENYRKNMAYSLDSGLPKPAKVTPNDLLESMMRRGMSESPARNISSIDESNMDKIDFFLGNGDDCDSDSDVHVWENPLLRSLDASPDNCEESDADSTSENMGQLSERTLVFQDVSITTTESVQEHRSSTLYTLYLIQYEALYPIDGGSVCLRVGEVKRRFREFVNLQSRLDDNTTYKKSLKGIKGPKRWLTLPFGNMDKNSVHGRQKLLENFLKSLIQKTNICNGPELKEFLAYEGDAHIAYVRKSPELSVPRIDKMLAKTVSGVFDRLVTALPSLPQDVMSGLSSRKDTATSIKDSEEKSLEDSDRIHLQFDVASDLSQSSSLTQGLQHHHKQRLSGDGTSERVQEVKPETTLNVDSEWQEACIAALPRSQGDGCDSPDTIAREPTSDSKENPEIPIISAILDIAAQALQGCDSSMSRERVTVTTKIMFGKALESWLRSQLHELTSDLQCVRYLSLLREAVWPNGHLMSGTSPPKTEEQKEMTKSQARESLETFLPGFVQALIGEDDLRFAVNQILLSLQYNKLNRHALYSCLDVFLEELFPDVKQTVLQQKLLS